MSDGADFNQFYAEQWPALIGLCRSYVGSTALAEETAQEVLFVAHRRWRRVSRLERPDLWLRRVATNQCISSWRRRRNELAANERHSRRDLVDQATPDVVDDQLWDAVRALPRKQQAAVCLHYVDGLTTAEVGEVLGCTASTVQTHLSRARTSLQNVGLRNPYDSARPQGEEGQ